MLLRSTRVLLLSAAIAVLVGCSSNSGTTLPTADFFVGEGQGFLIKVGQTGGVQTLSGTIFLVNFNNVLGDSRCPEGVTCVQEGAATIALSVQTSLALNDVEVDIPPSGTGEVVVEELTIEFIRLTPAAEDGVQIDLLDYELGLRAMQTGDIGVPAPQ